MAAAAKKKEKKGKKGVTVSLNSFLLSNEGGGSSGGSPATTRYVPPKAKNWAEEMDDHDDGEEFTYGTAMKNIVRAQLPTAPRAARGPDVDLTLVPTKPPFKAYLGNLQYDITPEDIIDFFGKLRVVDVSLPQDMGRQKGFGYAEFGDRQDLIDALGMNDEMLQNRKIRIDLAAQNDRDRGFGGSRRDGEDRGEMDRSEDNDWRRNTDRPVLGGKRDDDRGGFDRRDDRGGFDRRDDRDRYSDRDSGYGRDRYRDSDRGPARDRGGYSRYGDRDGGSSFDRSSFGTNRDRYDDRDRGGFGRDRDRDGGRDGGRGYGSGYRDDRGPRENRYEPPRDRGYDRDPPRDYDRRDAPRDDPPRGERPKLNLQKRTKPVEEPGKPSTQSSSIFGSAKPVDTAAKEREIEGRLLRERDNERRIVEEEKENRERVSSSSSRTRRESSGSQDGSSGRRERKLSSSSSGKGIRTVAPPPGSGSARVRRDSALSDDEDVFHDGKPTSPASNQSTPPKHKTDKHGDSGPMPAPPPKENPWERRKPSSDEPHRSVEPVKEQEEPVEPTQTSPPKREAVKKEFVPAEAPKENIWDKRRQQGGSPGDRANPSQPQRDLTDDSHTGGKVWGGGRGAAHTSVSPSADAKKGKRERALPKSVEEMPKYEDNQTKDFSDANKFSSLLADDENGVSDKDE